MNSYEEVKREPQKEKPRKIYDFYYGQNNAFNPNALYVSLRAFTLKEAVAKFKSENPKGKYRVMLRYGKSYYTLTIK